MFKRYQPGEKAPGGKYWNFYSGDYAILPKEGGTLPEIEGSYVAVSPLLIMCVGPFLGLAYMMFLPITVPLMLAQFAAHKVQRIAASVGRSFAG